jgi:acetyltransferase-like isoleucine patch superfamily enzyme
MRTLKRLLGKLAYFLPGGNSVRPFIHRWRGVRLGRNVWISQYVHLDEIYPEAIHIGNNCTIGLRASIFSHVHWGPRHDTTKFKPVVLEDNVFVGPHCVILPGVRIGEGAVIKAGSVLTRNVPSRTFWGDAGGGPLATITVPLTSEHSYDEFVRGLRPLRSAARATWSQTPPESTT